MTGPIIFSNETGREQLVDHGVVVTFRKSERTTGKTWWRETRTGPKQGDVVVEQVNVVDPRNPFDLDRYVEVSGFETTEDWMDAISDLHGGLPDLGFMYRVKNYSRSEHDRK